MWKYNSCNTPSIYCYKWSISVTKINFRKGQMTTDTGKQIKHSTHSCRSLGKIYYCVSLPNEFCIVHLNCYLNQCN